MTIKSKLVITLSCAVVALASVAQKASATQYNGWGYLCTPSCPGDPMQACQDASDFGGGCYGFTGQSAMCGSGMGNGCSGQELDCYSVTCDDQ